MSDFQNVRKVEGKRGDERVVSPTKSTTAHHPRTSKLGGTSKSLL